MNDRWSDEEDEVLVAYMSFGAEYVSKMLRAEVGTRRSPHAVECRAHKLGLSLAKYEVCPNCGRAVPFHKLSRATGMCRVCNERELAERTRQRRYEAERGYTEEDEAVIARYRRERNKERKALQRTRESTERRTEN